MLSVRPLLSKIKQALRDPRCMLCQTEGLPANLFFCDSCLTVLSLRDPEPIRVIQETRIYSASRFTPKIRSLLYGYKFYHRQRVWQSLSAVLKTYWQNGFEEISAHQQVWVCPIPPRAGMASHLIPYVQDFTDYFGYRMEPRLLRWKRETLPQHSLPRKSDRLLNVTGGMAVYENLLQQNKGSDRMMILLVDDILTTGGTMGEALRAVRNAFPEASSENLKIIGLTLTHIPLSYR